MSLHPFLANIFNFNGTLLSDNFDKINIEQDTAFNALHWLKRAGVFALCTNLDFLKNELGYEQGQSMLFTNHPNFLLIDSLFLARMVAEKSSEKCQKLAVWFG